MLRFRILFAAALLPLLPHAASAQQAPLDARIAQALRELVPPVRVAGRDYPQRSLEGVMARRNVPGVSIAVIDDGRIAWTGAFGIADAGTGRAVTPQTLFQAASISKPVAATAALALVEQGRLALDRPVNEQLASWRLPDHDLGGEPVTLRRLLTHTAGLTVSGFPGYAPGVGLPTIVQILNGELPANTAPVRVDLAPGSEWRYSGGGITVAQLMMTDAAGEPFPQLMERLVLGPLGMNLSSYEQPLPEARRGEAAVAHEGRGRPMPGGYHSYPEMAAAGLWTTPSDLARWAIALSAAYRGEPGAPIRPETAREMLSAGMGGWGLGVAVQGEGRDLRFTHGGSNEGYRALLIAYPERRQGVVIMTNGDNGGIAMSVAAQAIGRALGWPDSEGHVLTAQPVAREALVARVGRYSGGGRTVHVALGDSGLVAVPAQGPRFELLHQGGDVYLSPDVNIRVEFESDPRSGRVVALTGAGTRMERQD